MAITVLKTQSGWCPKIQPGQQYSFGASGSNFGTEQAASVTAGTDQQLPPGFFMIVTPANGEVVYTPDSGSTYRIVIPASSGGLIYSDGFNVLLRSASGTVTIYYTPIGSV